MVEKEKMEVALTVFEVGEYLKVLQVEGFHQKLENGNGYTANTNRLLE
ncbi:hypothetical protein P5F78_03840 [Shouchella clausii]|nr:hypothetical protein [Shouchella clausii]MED4157616.1 hypothetical protein [Shouchella clausii]